MKTSITLCLAALGIAAGASAHPLRIIVRNLRSDRGAVLLVATGPSKPLYGRTVPKEGAAVFTFDDIAADSLAISVIHDENGDMRLDMTDGKPAEGCLRRVIALPAPGDAVEMELRYDFTAPAESAPERTPLR